MPLYEYECEACHRRFELIRKFSDPPLEACPTCGGAVQKLMSSPAFQFKGSGWYITDYAKKEAPSDAGESKTDGKAKDGASGAAAGTSETSDKPEKAAKSDGGAKSGTSDAAPASPSSPATKTP